MATVLLVVIYIAFIGLGIPDSLFGTAWPAMGPALGAQVADASFVTVLISAGTVASSLMSARLIARFGPGIITAASTRRTAVRRAEGFLFPTAFRAAPSMIPQWRPRWADSRRNPQ